MAKAETKNSWTVTLPSGVSFPMVGAPSTKKEAQEYIKTIWPKGKVS